jgi:hypothetical protein
VVEVGIHRLELGRLSQLPQQLFPKSHQDRTALRDAIEPTEELLSRWLGRADQGDKVLGTDRLGISGSNLPNRGGIGVELRGQGLKKSKLALARERLVLIKCTLSKALANGLPRLSKEAMAILKQALELPLLVGFFSGLA